MPAHFLRRLTGRTRTRSANRQLGAALAFVAGAVNAGGFLAIQQYTSNMTGIVTSISEHLALGNLVLAMAGLGALLAFISGAATTAVMVNWARHRRMHSEYALSLALEALLLLAFGLLGANLSAFVAVFVPVTVLLLCFIMGLQNAVITKISHAEIRTTHVTGLVTDLGIELGKMFYWNRHHTQKSAHYVAADRDKLLIHVTILAMFFIGGVAGALGFKAIGFLATLPLAAMLLLFASMPILDDLFLASAGQSQPEN
ncbi:MAG: DUF1275 domain-containing protein [Proteobacteria bacterium]|nr:DUF1275 domain-containing protein [Pseudomonadota bacterium]